MIEVLPTPSKEELVAVVEEAGSSEQSFFGFPEREDGLFLQQDPEEYGSFVHYVATKVPPAKLSLDIGIASGGQTKFLRDYYPADETIVVDLGEHVCFPHWDRIKKTVNSKVVLELIDDSHSPRVREALRPFRGKVDFAFVDGDHSYRGLRKDIFLVKELIRPGGHMVLHDTAAVGDCKRVFDELIDSPDFTLVRNFQQRFGISLWRLIRVKRMPNGFNRAFGIGRI